MTRSDSGLGPISGGRVPLGDASRRPPRSAPRCGRAPLTACVLAPSWPTSVEACPPISSSHDCALRRGCDPIGTGYRPSRLFGPLAIHASCRGLLRAISAESQQPHHRKRPTLRIDPIEVVEFIPNDPCGSTRLGSVDLVLDRLRLIQVRLHLRLRLGDRGLEVRVRRPAIEIVQQIERLLVHVDLLFHELLVEILAAVFAFRSVMSFVISSLSSFTLSFGAGVTFKRVARLFTPSSIVPWSFTISCANSFTLGFVAFSTRDLAVVHFALVRDRDRVDHVRIRPPAGHIARAGVVAVAGGVVASVSIVCSFFRRARGQDNAPIARALASRIVLILCMSPSSVCWPT